MQSFLVPYHNSCNRILNPVITVGKCPARVSLCLSKRACKHGTYIPVERNRTLINNRFVVKGIEGFDSAMCCEFMTDCNGMLYDIFEFPCEIRWISSIVTLIR